MYPRLSEIHRYQKVKSFLGEELDPYVEPDDSLERLCTTLSPLRHLRVLLLDIVFTHTPTYDDVDPELADRDGKYLRISEILSLGRSRYSRGSPGWMKSVSSRGHMIAFVA
ncbi:hypothetical protein B0H10DRAFT_2189783 [Mycena sp. CBHHK59/15]|nr:hypothetical protein B0H10DRAFT_2189783 [Mycena sp. CBHHK59/15]